MNKVYIVCEACEDTYYEGSPKAVFDTKEKAEIMIKNNPQKEYYIEEFELK